MKKLLVLIAATLVTCVMSCTDDRIGSSISDTKTTVVEDSLSFELTGSSVFSPRLQSRTITQLIGRLSDASYGNLSSEVVAQMMPTMAIDTIKVKSDQIDSCKLLLRIPAAGGFTGDSLVPMRMSVYRLTKQLPSPIYSDFDPTDYFDPSQLLGEVAYSAGAATQGTDTQINRNYLEVAVPMPVGLARELFDSYVEDPERFATPRAFAKIFPGVYIANSYGAGRVMNIYDTRLVAYYHRTVKSSTGNDSIAKLSQAYAAVTPEVVVNNVLRLDVAQALDDAVVDGAAIVASPAGYEVKVTFPIREIIESFKMQTHGALSVVNTLEMTIPVEEIANKSGIKPPAYLLVVKSSLRDQFIASDSLTNDKDSFYASYNASKKCYVIDGMRDYMLDIIKNKGGEPSADDMTFTIMPVDVTTYVQSATYYSAAVETVTKIAPAVSKPAMARLRLDKAKIKIVYNKQMLF